MITDEPAVYYEPSGHDPLKRENVKITTDWTDSVNKTRSLQNGVQAWYTDATRNSFAQETLNISGEGYDIISEASGAWSGNMVADIASNNGVLSYSVADTTDPFVLTNNVKLSAANYNTVKITIETEYASGGNLYIITGTRGSFNGEQVVFLLQSPENGARFMFQ